jgi:hypothetical protein
MSYGLRVYNDSGFLQVDQDYKNYSLHQAGTIVTSSQTVYNGNYGNYTGYGFWSVSFPALDHTPLVFVKINNTSHMIGGTPTKTGVSGRVLSSTGTNVGTATGITVSYAVFRRDPVQSSDSQGLRIFNASGQLTFDSGKKPLRVCSVLNFHPLLGTSTHSKTLSYSSSLGMVWMQITGRLLLFKEIDQAYGGGYYYEMFMRNTAAGTIQTHSVVWDDSEYTGPQNYYGLARPSGTIRSDISFTGALSNGIYP